MTRRILYVDLGDGTSESGEIDRRLLDDWIGGRGLAAKLFYDDVHTKDPFDPDNPVYIVTSPTVGVIASTNRTWVTTASPLTGWYTCAAGGGFWGMKLLKTGYLAIRITGASKKPVYVAINEHGKAQVKEGKELWGLNNAETEEALKSEGTVLRIGPAGENKVLIAGTYLEDRAAARGGTGAVLGSKKLKAIVVKPGGDYELPLVSAPGGKELQRNTTERVKQRNMAFHEQGTLELIKTINDLDGWPTDNWRQSQWERRNLEWPFIKENHMVGYTTCFNCAVRCTKKMKSRYGDGGRGIEYETTWAFGPHCCNDDLHIIVEANHRCDLWGLDTISTGNTIGWFRECCEKGLVKYKFDSNEKILELIDMIATRKKPWGDLLANGSRKASQEVGKGSEDFAIQQQGMELPAYDPRTFGGMLLCYTFGPRHGCHNKAWTVAAEMSMPPDERTSLKGKAQLASTMMDETAIVDSLGICQLTTPVTIDESPEPYVVQTGRTYTIDEMRAIGRRIVDLERKIDVDRGLTHKHDTLPKRILEEPVIVGGKEFKVGTGNFEALKQEFYSIRGW